MKPNKAIKEVAKNYNQFPKEFLKVKNGSLVFIHQHGNLDRVLMGMDLLARGNAEILIGKSLLAVSCIGTNLKPNQHVFVGLPRVKGVANAYVDRIEAGVAFIGSMSSGVLK